MKNKPENLEARLAARSRIISQLATMYNELLNDETTAAQAKALVYQRTLVSEIVQKFEDEEKN